MKIQFPHETYRIVPTPVKNRISKLYCSVDILTDLALFSFKTQSSLLHVMVKMPEQHQAVSKINLAQNFLKVKEEKQIANTSPLPLNNTYTINKFA